MVKHNKTVVIINKLLIINNSNNENKNIVMLGAVMVRYRLPNYKVVTRARSD